jgi:hypothetical protein
MTDAEYLDAPYLIFEDRDTDIQCRSIKLVITRKPHDCMVPGPECGHSIPAGTKVVCDSALVDGEFGRYYCCLPCIEREVRALEDEDDWEDDEESEAS